MTCQKSMFEWTLKQASNSDLINNIFVTDNTVDSAFDISVCKLHVIQNQANIYVNPSWNQAMERVSSDYYIICNDDILVSPYVYNIALKALQDSSIGLVTFKTLLQGDITTYVDLVSTIDYKNTTYSTSVPDGRQGWIMAGRTKDWITIPEDIKIWFGDDFIYNTIKLRGMKTIISDYPVLHHQSTTLNHHPDKKEFDSIIRHDRRAWQSIKHQLNSYI